MVFTFSSFTARKKDPSTSVHHQFFIGCNSKHKKANNQRRFLTMAKSCLGSSIKVQPLTINKRISKTNYRTYSVIKDPTNLL